VWKGDVLSLAEENMSTKKTYCPRLPSLRPRFAFTLVVGVCLCASAAHTTRWTLVDFGSNDVSTVTPYNGWTQVVRHAARTLFVDPDGNPDHAGLRVANGLNENQPAYFGIRGTVPIDFSPGNEIIVTFYNRSSGYPYPTMRVSFTDTNAPNPADPELPWYTIYNADIAINTTWVPPHTLFEMRLIRNRFSGGTGTRQARQT
jgi:hypothetical protein